jgi:hypothetical protein
VSFPVPGWFDRLASRAIPVRLVFRYVAALFMLSVGFVLISVFVLKSPEKLLGESGFFEVGSVVFLGLLALTAVIAAIRTSGPKTRIVSAWFGWVACLAALRELDLHTLLNPKFMGEWGVRYRIDWWLSGSVPITLKLLWSGVLGFALFFTIYPAWKNRKQLWRLWLSYPVSTVLVSAGAMFMAAGVFIDDPLRNVTVVSKQTKSLIEEGVEWFGAGLFCVGATVLLRAHAREERESSTQFS